MGRELQGMRLGVIGFGRIGRMVVDRANAFGVSCTAIDTDRVHHAAVTAMREFDIVTVHVDLNETTRGMCNAEFFAAMKPGAYFINTSRGQVVDEAALLDALKSWQLSGAALDVVCGEPDCINPELVRFANEEPDRLILTPHIGGFAQEAIEKAETALARKLIEVVNGSER